jgi:hypothetical protein
MEAQQAMTAEPTATQLNAVQDALVLLAEARASYVALQEAKAKAVRECIPAEVAACMDKVAAEYDDRLGTAHDVSVLAEATVRDLCILQGSSSRASGLEALYCEGRTTWDTKGLDKACKLIPALNDYRKVGEPYCTIRLWKEVKRDDPPAP